MIALVIFVNALGSMQGHPGRPELPAYCEEMAKAVLYTCEKGRVSVLFAQRVTRHFHKRRK
jgi:hypothetical protein